MKIKVDRHMEEESRAAVCCSVVQCVTLKALTCDAYAYGVATISRHLKNTGLYWRI